MTDATEAEQTEAARTVASRTDSAVRKVEASARRVMRWFPVRVWTRFSERNGLVLAAGVSYQALFAVFAALYLAIAGVALWLGGSRTAINGLIDIVDQYLPGLIGTDDVGVISREAIIAATRDSASLFGVTGAIALGVVIWTATGWVTFTRAAVRDILGLPREAKSFALLKFRDFLASLVFALLLLVGFALSSVATWALSPIFQLLSWPTNSVWFDISIRAVTLMVTFLVDAVALVALFRFLIEADLRSRRVWPASLLAGGAIAVLQAGAGLLIGATPSNPLLATFAVMVGLLLWFRIVMMVILIAAAWIAVSADDDNVQLVEKSAEQREFDRQSALLLAARVRLRQAQRARSEGPWYRSFSAARELNAAEANLDEVQSAYDVAKHELEESTAPFARREPRKPKREPGRRTRRRD